MAMVSFVDETTSGGHSDAWHLEIFEERLTLREVIRRRVFQEVTEREAAKPRLVQPSGGARTADPEAQFAAAVTAFERGGFLVLADDRQVTDLDVEIDLRRDTEITFLKLVPLVGG